MNFKDYGKHIGSRHCSASEPYTGPLVFSPASTFPASPPALPCTHSLFQPHGTSCSHQNVPCPLRHQGLSMQPFFSLNHCVHKSSSGEFRFLLRTSNVTASTSSANSSREVTHLPPLPQCCAHTSVTALSILHCNYWLTGLSPSVGSACLRSILSREPS